MQGSRMKYGEWFKFPDKVLDIHTCDACTRLSADIVTAFSGGMATSLSLSHLRQMFLLPSSTALNGGLVGQPRCDTFQELIKAR